MKLISNHKLFKNIKRDKKPESYINPKSKDTPPEEILEEKNFKDAGGDSSFYNWTEYSQSVKKMLYTKFNFQHSNWNESKESLLHSFWEKRVGIEVAAKSLR